MKKLNSIKVALTTINLNYDFYYKVKWNSKTQQTYTEALLKMIFCVYGAIKECIIFSAKNCAIIEFILTSSAVLKDLT